MRSLHSSRRIRIAISALSALLFSGCQVRPPGTIETTFIQTAKRHLTVRGRNDRNPLPASEENIRRGQKNFGAYCVVCHGLDGQNTGVPFADKISPPVPALNSSSVQAYTDGQLHWIIRNGIFPSGMPASKDVFRDEEIWQMVLFIRHLPPKGSLGSPSIYGEGFRRDVSHEGVRTADLIRPRRGSYPRMRQ